MNRKQVTRDRYGDVLKVVEFHEPRLSIEAVIKIVWRILVISHAIAFVGGALIDRFVITSHL